MLHKRNSLTVKSNHAQTHLSAVMFGGGTAIAVRWRGDLLGHGGTFLL